ncbi:hypothetical protein, partial [Streptomyces halstedii]|uniref:hypothetical protein n=2 Tax=Streptomyces TaxID=1883 RepID=UPI0033B10D24
MTTTPVVAARLALQDAEAALARLRPALAAAYGLAGEKLTKAADQLDVAEHRAETAKEDAEIHRANHQAACRTIAEIHEAATGRTGMGPIRGVVEDVADVRARAEQVEANMKEIAKAYDRHRRALAAIFALRADAPFEEITEYAARTLNRTGGRLAAAEQVRAEAVRVADRATQTLLRIKHARTAADAWTALGTHYHLPATEAGRRARDWRSTAERDATERAEAAAVLGTRYMGDAERFHAAWQSARSRARAHLGEQQRIRGWLTHWADRARFAESDAERF